MGYKFGGTREKERDHAMRYVPIRGVSLHPTVRPYVLRGTDQHIQHTFVSILPAQEMT